MFKTPGLRVLGLGWGEVHHQGPPQQAQQPGENVRVTNSVKMGIKYCLTLVVFYWPQTQLA